MMDRTKTCLHCLFSSPIAEFRLGRGFGRLCRACRKKQRIAKGIEPTGNEIVARIRGEMVYDATVLYDRTTGQGAVPVNLRTRYRLDDDGVQAA
jgi:hypothetical protein